MKHPRPVYVGQANFANGPQQVNNGGKAELRDQYAHRRAGAGEIEKVPNELLKHAAGELRLDDSIGAQGRPLDESTPISST